MVSHVFPVGFPKTGINCGRPSCRWPGLIFLERKEAEAYELVSGPFASGRTRARCKHDDEVRSVALQPILDQPILGTADTAFRRDDQHSAPPRRGQFSR
jgi:hypothetical protein